MRVGRAAELVLAAAKHLRVGLELNVNFEADDGLVIGGGACGGGHSLGDDFDGITE
jgi:hypothetical protein